MTITKITTRDARFQLKPGQGADSVHTDPHYSFAVTELHTDGALGGTGITFTLGAGNEIVCEAIKFMAQPLVGREIEDLMATWGATWNALANHHQFRWLGPHKGVVHLALASITNACFDLWAKSRGVPMWKLLLDLTPQQIVALLDLSYLEDVLSADEAVAILENNKPTRGERESILQRGYPGYDTSVGWIHYGDDQIKENAQRTIAEGFRGLKLKVGSPDTARDVRRAHLLREAVGPDIFVMLDANQKWSLPQAIRVGLEFAPMSPYWIEEPTHPDDVAAHQTLARALSPIKLALGEHVPHRVLFKNFFQSQAVGFCQADCTRLGGVNEWIAVALMARKFGVPMIPHVGEVGQLHQHLVLFSHIAIGHPALFLEYIPHLYPFFVNPAVVKEGRYQTTQVPGASTDLK
jgi:L-fuconate dehydratase